MAKKCRISKYNVINGGVVAYGYRCLTHGVMSQRFSTPELRAQRIDEHQQKPKSTKKF